MTDKDQITGQTAVGRSVVIPGQIASTPTTWVKYTNSLATGKKSLDWPKCGQVKTGPT